MDGYSASSLNRLRCLIEFSPGPLYAAKQGGVEAFLDFFDQDQTEIYWIEDSTRVTNVSTREGVRLSRVSKEDLRRFAVDMSASREVDYSRDILVFFSPTARSRCFRNLDRSFIVDQNQRTRGDETRVSQLGISTHRAAHEREASRKVNNPREDANAMALS